MKADVRPPPPASPILIVEDDPSFGPYLCEYLESKGYRVQLATSGAAALAQFAALQPSLAVTDIYVPDPDGIELIKAFLKTQPALPIIAISGASDPSFLYLRAARALGARATLEKPFAGVDLLNTIERLLDQRAPSH